jgi:hypothetical protein
VVYYTSSIAIAKESVSRSTMLKSVYYSGHVPLTQPCLRSDHPYYARTFAILFYFHLWWSDAGPAKCETIITINMWRFLFAVLFHIDILYTNRPTIVNLGTTASFINWTKKAFLTLLMLDTTYCSTLCFPYFVCIAVLVQNL